MHIKDKVSENVIQILGNFGAIFLENPLAVVQEFYQIFDINFLKMAIT